MSKLESKMPGKIIILNGTSSSGKTSIARALQDLMDEPYLDAGLDRFLWMLPKRYLDRPLWDDVLGLNVKAGETGRRLVTGMHRAIKTLSLAGINVVADHVLVERSWVVECITLFSELPAYLVGVHCPLEVLEQRERLRKNRTLGQAREQFEVVHSGLVYDVEVNTAVQNPLECAMKVKDRVEDGNLPNALKFLRDSDGWITK